MSRYDATPKLSVKLASHNILNCLPKEKTTKTKNNDSVNPGYEDRDQIHDDNRKWMMWFSPNKKKKKTISTLLSNK